MINILKTALAITVLILSGCATQQDKTLALGEQPLVQLPQVETDASADEPPNNNIGFEDISMSDQEKMQELTRSGAIKEEINKYRKTGHADTRMLADGTVLFPYGLAQAKVICAPLMFSKIILQEGERITDVSAGDSSRWNVKASYKGSPSSFTPIVLIKPLVDGATTNLSIITDKHDYDIIITTDGDYIPRIGFYYPQDDSGGVSIPAPPQSREDGAISTNMQIQNVRFNYVAEGDKSLPWFPVNIFDDGNKVFIQMSPAVSHYELPIFMKFNDKGQQEMVNYRYRQPYYIIDSLFNEGLLILRTDKSIKIIKIRKKK
jgi:P-type conjugative transfer protein TrbG